MFPSQPSVGVMSSSISSSKTGVCCTRNWPKSQPVIVEVGQLILQKRYLLIARQSLGATFAASLSFAFLKLWRSLALLLARWPLTDRAGVSRVGGPPL